MLRMNEEYKRSTSAHWSRPRMYVKTLAGHGTNYGKLTAAEAAHRLCTAGVYTHTFSVGPSVLGER